MKAKIVCALMICHAVRYVSAAENDLQFNPAFLNGESGNIADLSWVNAGSALPPGEYNINVYINKNYAFTGNVAFSVDKNAAQEDAQPCVTPQQIAALGIDSRLAAEELLPLTRQCYFLNHAFPGASFDFDQKTLTLNLSLPQSYMRNLPRGYVSPESWEAGIPAAWLNYVVNGANNEYRGDKHTRARQLFVSLNSGVNLGAWRLRDYTTWTKDANTLNHVQTWLQRDIPALGAQAYAGETYTSAQVFDSVGLRGLALKTDDNMLPASLNGYAPEVRGIARSSATVTVQQNGNTIYQTSVPAGEFMLKDLYPTSSGGDLQVTIEESDGSKTQYTVPFASVPNLVRSGQIKYALGAGKLRAVGGQNTPTFAQGELFFGWEYGLTFYGGAQLAERYSGLALGVGQNLGRFGAYSVDVTHARSVLADDRPYSGDSVRLRYSKRLNDIGTRFNFYSLRYSTQGFYTLSDTAYKGMTGGTAKQVTGADGAVTTSYENLYNLHMSRKAKNQLLLSQPMGRFGSLSLSWDRQTYWRTANRTQSMQFAWNAMVRNVSVGVSVQRSTSLYDSHKDNIVAMSLSVPFGNPQQATRARFTTTRADSTGATGSAGVSGYVPGQESLFYSVNQRYGAQQRYGGDAALQYAGQRGDYSLGYSYSSDSRNLSYGMSGGAVLHEDGLTLSQPLGNTNILVKAPGAGSVAVLNHKGIKTDSRGYAVIPYATPYRVNQVALDVTTAGNDVELENAIVSKTPTDGALVRATIVTRRGAKALFTIGYRNEALPFGTVVTLADEQASGIVGDGGSLYLAGLPAEGTLSAVWGQGSDKKCVIKYRLNPQDYSARTGLYSQEAQCQ
ncbi:fimbria/pilus outer membrane usher protein [Raoultella terrigena]|uniref:fimbria/pilus outer membrane usher protein n=1 Tax=Raoultella terrigena TaxID=577 RepID=UPI00349F92DA